MDTKPRIVKNNFYNVDRGLIEYTAIDGLIYANTGLITTYSDSSGGVPASRQLDRVACVELYGYHNEISHNKFTLNRTKPNEYSPKEFNGIKLMGKTTDPASQPLHYKNIWDYSAYWNISHNTITGFTHKVIDATNDKIRDVRIRHNLFRSANVQSTPIEILGYGWNISQNVFDMIGSPRLPGAYVVGVFYLQKDKPKSIIYKNLVLGEQWNRKGQPYSEALGNLMGK